MGDRSDDGLAFFFPFGLDGSPIIVQTLEYAREKLGKCLDFFGGIGYRGFRWQGLPTCSEGTWPPPGRRWR
jgi:hypothetical protein